MKFKKCIAVAVSVMMTVAATGCSGGETGKKAVDAPTLALEYKFDESGGSTTVETVSGKSYKINYVFGSENADSLFKQPNDPLRRSGVKGKSLYMDGFSESIANRDFVVPKSAATFSAWVAPRGFENLANYDGGSLADGNPRLTSVLNKGDVEMGEGFLLGYGRLGMWGIQLALYNKETGEDTFAAFYDPINTLPLYTWSHIAVSFDGSTGYIGLFYNGEAAYEAVIPELEQTEIVSSEEPLYVGCYSNPMIEYGIKRQYTNGLLDEVKIYKGSMSPKAVESLYTSYAKNGHPELDFKDIALDSSVYDGDRYRPQYHAIPPAVWMNEPHSPFYYKGRYHVFYQHNPQGPYWSQIRWAHIVSDDMVHWEYVKDAVVPTAGICPEGVWTGGACIGPDGTPWLVITAGTNTSGWSGQNIAYAHAVDPDDPDLTDWVVEDKVVITQPGDNSQGERDQFRDPFTWYDDETDMYYMLVSTSIPGAGGSANIYTSTDMREWESQGYLFECDYNLYPEQGAHWECVVMLPISTKDGSATKYILFDCPQYTVDGYVVDCYYWIGTFDKTACRFIADDPKPRLFDMGRGVYTGQNGFCFRTDEEIEEGKTYEQGRTVIYAIAQGKDAGTAQNYNAGWAHNFAIPLELWLADNGRDVLRAPIKETESLRGETLYEYSGAAKSASEINDAIANIRGDMLEIRATITLAPAAETYKGGLSVRYNPNTVNGMTERSDIVFSNNGVYIDRAASSLLDYVNKQESYHWNSTEREYEITILLDRSMLEVYVDGVMSFTTRIYPKYGDSDHLHVFDDGAGIKFTSLEIYRMKGAYKNDVAPPYYGNVGNLAD